MSDGKKNGNSREWLHLVVFLGLSLAAALLLSGVLFVVSDAYRGSNYLFALRGAFFILGSVLLLACALIMLHLPRKQKLQKTIEWYREWFPHLSLRVVLAAASFAVLLMGLLVDRPLH